MTFGGVNMHLAKRESIDTGAANGIEAWYMLESDIPSGAQNFVVTWDTTPDYLLYGATTIDDVFQRNPFYDRQSTTATSASSIGDTINVTDRGLTIAAAVSSALVVWESWSGGMDEQTDQSSAGHTFGAATQPQTSTGTDSTTATSSSSADRLVMVYLSLNPVGYAVTTTTTTTSTTSSSTTTTTTTSTTSSSTTCSSTTSCSTTTTSSSCSSTTTTTYSTLETGYQACAANGDDYTAWSNALNCYVSDQNYSKTNTNGNQHDWYNFTLGLDSGDYIKGIQIRIEGWDGGKLTGCDVEISWNGGTSYTTTGYGQIWPGNDTKNVTYVFGGVSDLWGRTWTYTELSNANFRVRLTKTGAAGDDFNVDLIEANITYRE